MNTPTPENQTPTPPTEAEYVRSVHDSTLPFDPELEKLVAFINLTGETEVSVTLHVGGAVISGMLISGQRYFRLLIDDIKNPARHGGTTDEAAASFAEFFRPSLEVYQEVHRAYQESGTFPPMPRHIHLRHAETYVASGPPLGPSFWRGRLAEVDGWSVGSIGVIPPAA